MVGDKISNPSFRTSGTDLVLIATVLLLALSAVIWTAWGHYRSAGQSRQVVVWQDRRVVMQAGLERDTVFPVLDGRMQIEVRAGRVRVAASDCPGHVCLHTGWISQAGQKLVCVPNRVLVEIRSVAVPVVDAVAN
ncbi:MAG: NusG domain II-containing protein [Candidatus Omnitrophica bacterium]|nr:NusG domain II-containing protein [Candidatus Omnitrophota bacterium]